MGKLSRQQRRQQERQWHRDPPANLERARLDAFAAEMEGIRVRYTHEITDDFIGQLVRELEWSRETLEHARSCGARYDPLDQRLVYPGQV